MKVWDAIMAFPCYIWVQRKGGQWLISNYHPFESDWKKNKKVYTNYSQGSIQIPSEYKSASASSVAAVIKLKTTKYFIKTISHFSLSFSESRCKLWEAL